MYYLKIDHAARLTAVLFIAASVLFSAVEPLVAETRTADQVFKKWLSWQRTYEDIDLSDVEYLDSPAIAGLAITVPEKVRPQLDFLKPPSLPVTPASDAGQAALGDFGERLRKTLTDLDTTSSIKEWIAELKKSATGFTSDRLNKSETDSKFRNITAKYREFLEWLSGHGESKQVETRRFAIANRFFEYCFAPNSHAQFRTLIDTPAWQPIARMLYANIWYNLSGNGWRYWHADTLAALRKRTRAGHEIVYIAGGSDIYLPILNGIYNIRIIDPMFPSQKKYYSEGWEYLIRGAGKNEGVGDTIQFSGQPGVTMRRLSYREFGRFETGELSDGKKLTLPKSETVWELRDSAGERLGQFTLERRFVTQADFRVRSNQALLISFNELYYITATGSSGWGIDPRKFPGNTQMYVKQLRRPVERPALVHMRETNEANFYYIKLGTSVD